MNRIRWLLVPGADAAHAHGVEQGCPDCIANKDLDAPHPCFDWAMDRITKAIKEWNKNGKV